jgi:hypothetical protein
MANLFNQLDADQSGSPSGVLSFHPAGGLDQRLVLRRGGAATRGVVRSQGRGRIGAVVAPEATDGAVRQTELGGDLGQTEILRSQHDNLMSNRCRDSTRHRESSGTTDQIVVEELESNHVDALRPNFPAR